MRNQTLIVIPFLMLWITLATDADADSYRCGRKIVKTGDSAGDLLRLCGEPRYKDRGYEKIRIEGQDRETRVERWYYRKSGRSLERVVYIYRGKISAIEVGSR